MNGSEAIVQEHLQLLEAGEPLAACLAGLTVEQGELVQAAEALRHARLPAQDAAAVAAHRLAVLAAAQQTLAARAAPRSTPTPLIARFQVVFASLRLHKEPALALMFILLLMFTFAWFARQDGRPEVALTTVLPDNNKVETAVSTAANNPEVAVLPPPASPISTAAVEAVAVATAAVETAAAMPLPANRTFIPLISLPLLNSPDKAALHNLRGLVEVQGPDGLWTAVAANTSLPAGSHIRTGSYSRADVAFYDGSQAALGPNSELSLDQVNALPPQTGLRTIVLTQWAGSSEHQVQFRNDGGSRYEVKTATGSGIARGTRFQVAVGSDGRAHYTVSEGKVDVSNGNRTVGVIAGQTTNFTTDEPPAAPQFIVTGAGVVTHIGDTWIIAGQSFAVNEQTTLIGEPEIGDIVYVEGYLVVSGDPVATRIRRLDNGAENQFSLTGPVTEMGETAWVVAGQAISVTADTAIDSEIEPGDIVRVHGVILLPGGHLVAAAIERLETEEGLPFEFVGIVQAITAESWTISGIAVAVDEETEIAGGIDVGDTVKVEGAILPDDTWLAQEIQLLAGDNATFSFTGAVMGIDPWLVAGIPFEVADWAHVEPGIQTGDIVRVSGIILDDGAWLATQIVRLPDDGILQIIFVGVVHTTNPWVISGLPIATNENTVFEGQIGEGDLVRVTAWIRNDGTWLATYIKRLGDDGNQGCVTITAVITALNNNAIVISNGQTIILDEGIIVEGELQVGSVILIIACVATDGTIHIISITVIYTPPPPPPPGPPGPPPPPGQGGDVTLCHKPGTPAEQTMTLPQPAVAAHLGHGDTLGPCP